MTSSDLSLPARCAIESTAALTTRKRWPRSTGPSAADVEGDASAVPRFRFLDGLVPSRIVALDSESSFMSTSSEVAAGCRVESVSKFSTSVLSSMLGKLASRRCGALRDTGRTCIIQSRSCHALTFARAARPVSVSSFNLSRIQRRTHSALARTSLCMISDRTSWSCIVLQSSGRPMICAAWRICSSRSEKSWLMACSRGRVDAGSFCEAFNRVSAFSNSEHRTHLLACLAPSCHLFPRLWMQRP